MEKSWFNFIFSHGEFESIGELSKATDSFAPFEINNDLSDLEFGFYIYWRSSYLYNGSKSDNDPHIKDTKYNFNNNINRCIDSYFRSHIGIDSNFLGDSNNSRDGASNNPRYVDLDKLWVQCDNCYSLIYRKFNKMYICEECGNYLKISSKERIELLIDPGTWDPMDEDMVSVDPIDWDSEEEPYKFNLEDDLKDHLKYLKKESEKLARAARRKLLDRDREAKRKLLDRDREVRRKLLESQEETSQVDSQEETSQIDSQEETSQVDSQEETSQIDSQEETSQVDLDSEEDETSQVDWDSDLDSEEDETSQVDWDLDSEEEDETSQVDWDWDSDSEEETCPVFLKRWQEQIDNFAREARRQLLEKLEESYQVDLIAREAHMEFLEKLQETSPDDWTAVDEKIEFLEKLQETSPDDWTIVDEKIKFLDKLQETYPDNWTAVDEKIELLDKLEESYKVNWKLWKEQIDKLARAARRKLLEWQEGNCPVDSDSEEEDETSQVDWDWDSDSEEEEETSPVDWDWDLDSEEKTSPVDSEEEEKTSPVDSEEEEKTSPVDSDLEEKTSPVDSEEEEKTSPVDSEEEEKTSPVDSEEEEEEEEETYNERIDSDQKTAGVSEAVQTGTGKINGIPVAIGVMDFDVIGGSMGSVVGEKITRLIEYATNQRLPLILVCSSGGARMQEGSLSLMQMAKISSALYDYQLRKRLFYISILASPTTGGVTASFGMLGDIVIAEPYAYIAFAGKRVIEETLKIEVPEGSQVAELLFETGLLDAIVPRNILKGVLSELFQLHAFNKN